MSLLAKLKILFKPWWEKSNHSGLETSLILLTNLSMQAAVFIATTPQKTASPQSNNTLENTTQAQNNSSDAQWDILAPIIVPMITNSINIVLFIFFQQRVADKLLISIKKRILFDEQQQANQASYANIAMIQNFANTELTKGDIENIGLYVNDASNYCEFIGEITNIIPMILYGRMAYLSLPEAHNVLFAAGAFTIGGCALQRYLFRQLIAADKTIKEKAIEIQSRLARDIRHYDAMVEGSYQYIENLEIDKIIQEKSKANFKFNAALSSALIINNMMYIALSTLTMAIVGQLYPQLRGTKGIITFSFAVNLFAGSLLRIIYLFGDAYAKSAVALNKIYSLDNLLNEINELKKEPFLKIFYDVPSLDKNIIIKFQDFQMVIPAKKNETEENKDNLIIHKHLCHRLNESLKCLKSVPAPTTVHKSAREIIADIIDSPESNLVDLPSSFTINASSMHRIIGSSGKGKSKLIETLLGIWPFAKGNIYFNCKRSEIFCMPQEDIFVKGTLLQNIYYPHAIPSSFLAEPTDSDDVKYTLNNLEAQRLIQTMQQLGLGDEVDRLGKYKDWGSERDLSPGMKKRFGFLRMYLQAMYGTSQPKIVILDEATSSVDPNNASCIEGLIRQLRQKFLDICILYIKHDQEINHAQFNSAQNELIKADHNFYQGLTDCAHIAIKYSDKKLLPQPAPLLLSGSLQRQNLVPSKISNTTATEDLDDEEAQIWNPPSKKLQAS